MRYENNTGYPSVTDILSPFVDKTWFKPEHARRGDAVHGAIKSELSGLFTPSLPPNWQPYLDSFRRFKKHIKKIILLEERIVLEDEGYCGQLDIMAEMDEKFDNAVALGDWKTSVAKYKWWLGQLGGYGNLAIKVKKVVPDIVFSARLRKEEGRDVLVDVYDYNDLTHFMRWFDGARLAYQNLL